MVFALRRKCLAVRTVIWRETVEPLAPHVKSRGRKVRSSVAEAEAVMEQVAGSRGLQRAGCSWETAEAASAVEEVSEGANSMVEAA